MKEYFVKSMLTGSVTLIIAKDVFDALKKGRKYFSDPNRAEVPVRILN